ncbi:DUF2730 family protein [Tistrella mobilis]|uniref:DUF2730 family protein n=1 Tax=Tistrella mobilis TaxID=171437 RepID=UPI0035578C19
MPEALKDWWPVISLATLAGLPLALSAMSWVVRRGLASQDDLRAALAPLVTDVADLRGRTQRLEGEVQHLPTADDIAELREALARMEGSVKTVASGQEAQRQALTRIEDYLLRDRAK